MTPFARGVRSMLVVVAMTTSFALNVYSLRLVVTWRDLAMQAAANFEKCKVLRVPPPSRGAAIVASPFEGAD